MLQIEMVSYVSSIVIGYFPWIANTLPSKFSSIMIRLAAGSLGGIFKTCFLLLFFFFPFYFYFFKLKKKKPQVTTKQ